MLQDIMKKVTQNASMQVERLGYISSNIANLSTNAYKSKSFELFMDESGRVQGSVRGNYAKGAIQGSKNPLDIAIDGPGYFYVTNPDGSTAYTRDGRLQVNAQGYLATQNGALIGNGIKVPINYYKLYINNDGVVKVKEKESDDPKEIGKINIVNFHNPGALRDIGQNMVVPTVDSGEPMVMAERVNIKQGATEKSNVAVWDTVSDVMRINGSYISSLRIVKYTDELYRQSVNLRQ